MFTTNWNEQETEDPSRKKLCFPEKRGGMGIFKQRMETVHDSAEKMEHKEKNKTQYFLKQFMSLIVRIQIDGKL